jgi:gamma-glutamyltranspeptidase/glutathione hydrolase
VHEDIYGWHPDSRAALRAPTGERLLLGDVVRLPQLAESLEAIGRDGAQTLYTGELAAVVAADMAANDGLLSAGDLAGYRASSGPALPVRVRDWTWSVLPPPSIGGPVLAAMLLLAAAQDPRATGPARTAYLARVAHAVLRFRESDLDVAEDRVPAATALLDDLRGDAPGWLTAASALRSPSTVHVSVVDSGGTACAVTSSSGYGSGVMTPGTGIWLNNCLGEPELNRRGLHAWAPGTRLPSNMAPTVGRRDDGAVLAAGSPGADRITTALLQVLSAVTDGAGLRHAVDALRWHVRLRPGGAALLETEDGLDVAAVPGLDDRETRPSSMYFGGVGAASLGPDGALEAAADPRRTGATRVVG